MKYPPVPASAIPPPRGHCRRNDGLEKTAAPPSKRPRLCSPNETGRMYAWDAPLCASPTDTKPGPSSIRTTTGGCPYEGETAPSPVGGAYMRPDCGTAVTRRGQPQGVVPTGRHVLWVANNNAIRRAGHPAKGDAARLPCKNQQTRHKRRRARPRNFIGPALDSPLRRTYKNHRNQKRFARSTGRTRRFHEPCLFTCKRSRDVG